MKEDTPGGHPNGRLPILDTEVHILEGRIVHYHYNKPMSSLEVILRKSSMSLGSKLDIFTQEANCSPSLPWNEKLKYVNKLMIQMKWAGYPETARTIVATRALAKMDNDVHNLLHLGHPIYRRKV